MQLLVMTKRGWIAQLVLGRFSRGWAMLMSVTPLPGSAHQLIEWCGILVADLDQSLPDS